MNNDSYIKNDDDLTSKIDSLTTLIESLIASINHQSNVIEKHTATIKNQTAVIDQLRFELVEKDAIIKDLKAQLEMNSQNSSKPSSTDGFKKPNPKSLRKPSGKKAGAQKGHKGSRLKLMKTPDKTIKHYPVACECCPQRTRCTSYDVVATRYEYDIVLKTKLTCHKQMACSCPTQNNKQLSGSFPQSITSSMQYGDNLRSFVVTLNTSGMIAIKSLHDILKTTFNIPISTGSINNMIVSMNEKLKPVLSVIKSKVTRSKVVHFDETSIPVKGKN